MHIVNRPIISDEAPELSTGVFSIANGFTIKLQPTIESNIGYLTNKRISFNKGSRKFQVRPIKTNVSTNAVVQMIKSIPQWQG